MQRTYWAQPITWSCTQWGSWITDRHGQPTFVANAGTREQATERARRVHLRTLDLYPAQLEMMLTW